jgi:hypothetical protein
MAHNFLQLNQDKTEVLIVGAKAQRENMAAHLNSQTIKIKYQLKNLGFVLDSELNFKSHIRNVTKIAFYHLRNIATVRPFLSQADRDSSMLLLQAALNTVMVFGLVYPRKPLVNSKAYRMLQHGY